MAVSKMVLRLALAVVGVSLVAASCPTGTTRVRYPGQDVMVAKNIAKFEGLSESACFSKCNHNDHCNSAVRLVRDSGKTTCYLKSGDISTRVPARNDRHEAQSVINKRFTVLGCSGAATKPPTTKPPTTKPPTTNPNPTIKCPAGTTFTRFSGFDVSEGKNINKTTGLTMKQCDKKCDDHNDCNSTVYLLFDKPANHACYTKAASVDKRVAVTKSERSRHTASGCAKTVGIVTPVDPATGTCDDKKCVSSSRTGSNKCAGSGIHNEVLSCCEANFKCYKNTDDFSQCRDSTQALPTRFEPTPLPCGTYGASGPGGYYGAKL